MHVAVNLKHFLVNLKAVTYNGILVYYVLLGVIVNSNRHQSSVQHVCIGGSITLFCNSSTGRARWTINLPESVEPDPVTRSISNTRLTEETFQVTVTVFHILRRSDYNTTPLVTSLLLENVSADINETNISCSIPNSDSDEILMQFMILVIDSRRHGANQTINVSKILEFYGINNYRVALEWAEEEDLLYNVSISPPAITTVLVGNTGAELTLLYNTPYSVTIAAVTQCGLNIATTTLNQLSQTQCAYPSAHDGSNIQVVDYVAPALEGSQVRFSCSPGLVLTGPNVSVCAGNGEWEPDPSQTRCKANCGPLMNNTSIDFQYNSTLEGSELTFLCLSSDAHSQMFVAVCQKSESWDPDPVSHCIAQNSESWSITMVIITAVITSTILLCVFFILGLVCGIILLSKFRKKVSNQKQKTDAEVEKSEEKDMEMMENVAYGPLHLRV